MSKLIFNNTKAEIDSAMNKLIFSWAEDADGRIVHVSKVSRGLKCGCFCPYCHERLLARKGEQRKNGFAHHSENRGANLKICYMVTMYKLAEQIIQYEKKIRVPSYYGIFKEKDIEFTEVVVDSRFDREDKQPDVIATTAEGKHYLIEFTFADKLKHKKKVNYEKMNCVEVDLSSQTLESLHNFLMHSTEDRKWLNNQTYFESIVTVYSQSGKNVRITDESDCTNCELKDDCCGIREKGNLSPILIENNGESYRVCKVEEYNKRKRQREEERKAVEERKLLLENEQRMLREKQRLQQEEAELRERIEVEEAARRRRELEEFEKTETAKTSPESRTCFMCIRNLDWNNSNDGYAHCGSYLSFGVPKNTPPDTAKTCRGFSVKLSIEL